MAVRRVGIEGHVADHAQRVARLPPDRPHCAAEEVVGVEGVAAIVGLVPAVDHGKQRDGRDAQVHGVECRLHDPGDREPLDAGHARDRLARLVLVNEQGPHEIGRREGRLGHQAAQPRLLPGAAEAGRGKTAGVRMHTQA